MMEMEALLTTFILIILAPAFGDSGAPYSCPSNCRCTLVNSKRSQEKTNSSSSSTLLSSSSGRKVFCQTNTLISYIAPSFISSLPKDTVQLDLSGNDIKILERNNFDGLSNLVKLNLSKNPISRIHSKSFSGLDHLEKLDLSGTKLTILNASMLDGMPKLERLYLLGTTIQNIYPGTFDVLPFLTRIDLQTNLLVCDCHLEWIVTWIKEKNIKLDEIAVCALPSGLKGTPIKSLKKHELHCESPLELPIFELLPSTKQVVFEGDKLPFRCRATLVDKDMTMTWLRDDAVVEGNRSRGIFVYMQSLPDQMLLTTMVLERLSTNHSGRWKCLVQSVTGNISKSVDVLVLAVSTGYCPSVVVETNKGRYSWPKTLSGIVQVLPCAIESNEVKARHSCDMDGQWRHHDVAACPYFNRLTRELELVAQLTSNRSCNIDCAKEVRYKMADLSASVSDVIDVIFLSHIISDLSKTIQKDEQLAEIVIDLSSSVMNIHEKLLTEAQEKERACSRIVKSVEETAEQVLRNRDIFSFFSKNIGVEARKMEPHDFAGMNCTNWITENHTSMNTFSCMPPPNVEISEKTKTGQHFGASILIPSAILKEIKCASIVCPQNDNFRIQAIIYRNARLFPVVDSSAFPFQISSNVIATKISGARVENATDQITVKILSSATSVNKTPVYWDFSANAEKGSWRSDGCSFESETSSLVTFRCNHLTNFAVAEGMRSPASALETWATSFYETSVIIHMGSAVLIICLLCVSITHVICRRSIEMSRKMRHAVVNLCICIILLCLTYTHGIRFHHPTSHVPCRVVGIIIHYLSLCTLFWITTITFKMLHHLSKMNAPQPTLEEAIEEAPKPKPIIAGYLLGWGVAVIICGISGAINWTNYGLPFRKYCFLSMDSALLTVFIPAGILGLFDLVLFVCIFCRLRRTSSSSTIVKNSVEDSDNEIQLLTSQNVTNHSRTDSNRSNSEATTSNNATFDQAYCPNSQLCALMSILLLFCSMWMAGAFAVTLPFSGLLPYNDVIFECLYAVLASALGAFMLVYFCVGRKDVRASCCSNSPAATSNWKYTPANGDAPLLPSDEQLIVKATNHENVSLTSQSARESNCNECSKLSSNAAISALTANLITPPPTTALTPNGGGQDYAAFYNPHQNGIAKKYWERTKRKRAVQLHKIVDARNGISSSHLYHDDDDDDDDDLDRQVAGNVQNVHNISNGELPNSKMHTKNLDLTLTQPTTEDIKTLASLASSRQEAAEAEADKQMTTNSVNVVALSDVGSGVIMESETEKKCLSRSQDFDGGSESERHENVPNGIACDASAEINNQRNFIRNKSRLHESSAQKEEKNGFLEQLELRIALNRTVNKTSSAAALKECDLEKTASVAAAALKECDLEKTTKCALNCIDLKSNPNPADMSRRQLDNDDPNGNEQCEPDSDVWVEQKKEEVKIETSV